MVSNRKKIIREKLDVYPYGKCLEAVNAYERQVNFRCLVMAPAIQGGLFAITSYFSSILYPVGKQLLSMQFWESQLEQFQPSILLDTFSDALFDASLGEVFYLMVLTWYFFRVRAFFGTAINFEFYMYNINESKN